MKTLTKVALFTLGVALLPSVALAEWNNTSDTQPAQEQIQSSKSKYVTRSTDGKFKITLISLKVADDIMTVTMEVKNISKDREIFNQKMGSIYYIDRANKKACYVLKDSSGAYLAGPIDYSNSLNTDLVTPGESAFVWMKFPAPNKSTEVIDINMKNILPFDGVNTNDETLK